MGIFSQAIRLHLPSTSPHCSFKFSSPRVNRKGKIVSLGGRTKSLSLQVVRSVLNNRKSSISDNGAIQPARNLLERLFAQTQKLEEQKSRNLNYADDEEVEQTTINLEILESDLNAVLTALKKREDDLMSAENKVILDHDELNRTKQELELRDRELRDACLKYEKLEEELKRVNIDLDFKNKQIEDLKRTLKEQDDMVVVMQSSLALKEDELEKLKKELANKIEEACRVGLELEYKTRVLNEANQVVTKQETEIQTLRKAITEKEEELEVSVAMKKLEEEKVRITETNLEKQTKEWFLACEELKKLENTTSRYMESANQTLDDFKKVKNLLGDVKSELISSRKALIFSRKQMEDKELLLLKQLEELEELKLSVTSYMTNLKDAQSEVESERLKLKASEELNINLVSDLLTEKERFKDLQADLRKEKSSLEKAIQDIFFLEQELSKKNDEFVNTENLLREKESLLVEAKVEIEDLKSDYCSLRLILQEKDIELCDARDKLDDVNVEVNELKSLMSSREDELVRATGLLSEKDEHVKKVEVELDSKKLEVAEAETVIQRIVELTSDLITSSGKEDYAIATNEEIELLKEKLDAKEFELKSVKEEMVRNKDDLNKLYSLAQERIGEKTNGELVIENLEFESAQLEIEAAINALEELANMSREMVVKGNMSIAGDSDVEEIESGFKVKDVETNDLFMEVKEEVARLLLKTEQLVKNAGIVAGELKT